MWQLKNETCATTDTGLATSKYSISATARNVGGQVTQKSRIPKAKRRYIVSKPCATDVTPYLLDATRVEIPMWIRTALHLHHRSSATDDRGVSPQPLQLAFALRSNFPSYDWKFSATVSNRCRLDFMIFSHFRPCPRLIRGVCALSSPC
jgi:hypothetical protein